LQRCFSFFFAKKNEKRNSLERAGTRNAQLATRWNVQRATRNALERATRNFPGLRNTPGTRHGRRHSPKMFIQRLYDTAIFQFPWPAGQVLRNTPGTRHGKRQGPKMFIQRL
jgi:hypothetical protein